MAFQDSHFHVLFLKKKKVIAFYNCYIDNRACKCVCIYINKTLLSPPLTSHYTDPKKLTPCLICNHLAYVMKYK